jgi:predicted small integral membrane protein
MRILVAIGVVFASLVTLPYILRAWPGLPWEVVRFAFVAAVILLVVVADRIYVLQRSKGSGGTRESE